MMLTALDALMYNALCSTSDADVMIAFTICNMFNFAPLLEEVFIS